MFTVDLTTHTQVISTVGFELTISFMYLNVDSFDSKGN